MNSIQTYIDQHHPEQVAFLAELVKAPSDNPPGDCAPHAAMTATWRPEWVLEAFSDDQSLRVERRGAVRPAGPRARHHVLGHRAGREARPARHLTKFMIPPKEVSSWPDRRGNPAGHMAAERRGRHCSLAPAGSLWPGHHD